MVFVLVKNSRYTDLFMYIIGPATLVWLGLGDAEVQYASRTSGSVRRWSSSSSRSSSGPSSNRAGGSLSLFALNNLNHSLFGFIPMDPEHGEQLVPTRSSSSFSRRW
jgi:POT family proton-dependent oligopeptide transporter